MNYYRRYVGDYLRDTARLSILEHGAYNLLLDYYYADEKPLPLDKDELYLMVRAMTSADRKAVDKVLGAYFTEDTDGYHQKRVDHEISVSLSARTNGKGGGRPNKPDIEPDAKPDSKPKRKPESKPINGTGLLTGLETGEGGGSGHPPTTNLQPPTTTPHPNPGDADASLVAESGDDPPTAGRRKRVANCDASAVIDAYEAALPMLPQVRRELWDGAPADALRARWRWVLTATKRDGGRYATTPTEAVDWFRRYFAFVAQSDFLTGRNGKWAGCDLAWLVKADNFRKVVQGNYENKDNE